MKTKSRTCVSLMGKNPQEIKTELEFLQGKSLDILEWRADSYYKTPDRKDIKTIESMIRKVFPKKQILFTFLNSPEPLPYTTDIYEEAIQSNSFDMIDLDLIAVKKELSRFVQQAKAKKMEQIVSWHDFIKTPSKREIKNKFEKMKNVNPDIIKFCFEPKEKADVLRLLYQINEFQALVPEVSFIAISSGNMGRPTRMLADWMQMPIQYAAGYQASAAGQFSLDELNQKNHAL